MGGIAMGLLTGILVSGPHFHEWPVNRSLALIACCIAGGAVIGWALLALTAGLLAETATPDYEDLRDDNQDDHDKRERSVMNGNDI
jgi:hypothetical protein